MSTNKNNEGYEETLPRMNLPDLMAAFKNTEKLLALEKYLGFPSPIDVMQKKIIVLCCTVQNF